MKAQMDQISEFKIHGDRRNYLIYQSLKLSAAVTWVL